uniref:Uncharacterized protein n=1 Tax=Arundo donax TaxID=35708 RepID=A0A0A9BTL0_ARUDO
MYLNNQLISIDTVKTCSYV